MDFDERMALRPVLWSTLHERTGNSFEALFHDIMTLCIDGFVDVRTHGNIGDQGSDGLSLHDGKLYACYAPEVPSAGAAISKLNSDIESALRQRAGQFSTFVFVHNDARGVHPEISQRLARLRNEHPDIIFELIGFRKLRDLLSNCAASDVEHVLGRQLPLNHLVSMGLDEMIELLGVLQRHRLPDDAPTTPHPVSVNKLAYSSLTVETQAELRDGMKHSDTIESYYSDRIDVTERDDVAARFQAEYRAFAEAGLDPEEILLGLRTFLGGSRPVSAPAYRAQTAALAFFFQSCDIFANPPADWRPPIGGSR